MTRTADRCIVGLNNAVALSTMGWAEQQAHSGQGRGPANPARPRHASRNDDQSGRRNPADRSVQGDLDTQAPLASTTVPAVTAVAPTTGAATTSTATGTTAASATTAAAAPNNALLWVGGHKLHGDGRPERRAAIPVDAESAHEGLPSGVPRATT